MNEKDIEKKLKDHDEDLANHTKCIVEQLRINNDHEKAIKRIVDRLLAHEDKTLDILDMTKNTLKDHEKRITKLEQKIK
ncbi:MAG: hypothetical protein IJG00_00495 [Clostridia bacterium]|nr:hypothetical protein [Clostridia bacterium]